MFVNTPRVEAKRRAASLAACTIHGHANRGKITKTYRSWVAMRERCSNPQALAYRNYGARGVSVCPRWDSFTNFLSDMGPRPLGKTLDRVDNQVGYCPGNCRWATYQEQGNNTRRTVILEFRGEKLSMKQWAVRAGMKYITVVSRVNAGQTPEQVLLTPVSGRPSLLSV